MLTSVIVIICSIRALQGNKFDVFENTKPINIALLIYFITCIISVVFSIDKQVSFFGEYKRFNGLLSLTVYLVLFIFSANFITKENVRILFDAVIVAAVITCIIGILQTDGKCYFDANVLRVESAGRIIRPFSTFGNTVFFSLFLVMSLPFLYLRIFEYKDVKIKAVYSVALLFVLFALIATQTRSGIIACTVSGIVFFVFSKCIRLRTVIVVCMGLLFIAILYGHNKEGTLWRFTNPAYYQGRIEIYENSVPIIKNNLVTGVGLDCVGQVLKTSYGVRNNAHNDFLQNLLCAGLLGLSAYIYLIVSFVRDVWRLYKRDNLLITTLFSSCLAYFVFIQFNPAHIGSTCLFWIFLGSIYGIKSNGRSFNPVVS